MHQYCEEGSNSPAERPEFVDITLDKVKKSDAGLMIPIPMIPLVIITKDKTLMGEFVNRKRTRCWW